MKRPPVFSMGRADRLAKRGTGARTQVLPRARLSGPMPWIIAIMVALSVLATGGALALSRFASHAQANLEGGATVQIVEADPVQRDARAAAALRVLEADPATVSVRIVPPNELARLIEPWLGDSARAQDLVMPALIEVRLDPRAGPAALPRLRGLLANAAPGARIDAAADWLGPVFAAIDTLRWLAAALILVSTAASAAAVWLAARNAFDANKDTIEIVHHLGASDARIARLFQSWVLGAAIMGGGIGLAVGAGVLWLVGTRFAALESALVTGGAFNLRDWLLIALVPAITAAVALLTARRTVMVRLRTML